MIIGYIFTSVYIITIALLIFSVIKARKALTEFLVKKKIAVALLVIFTIAFFAIFSLLYVHPVEQLYFDENIYQGIALNILMHGNALWCQYGTGYLHQCYANALYHDPVEWSFFLAIAFLLFGIGISTAYATQLVVGLLSILMIFLLVRTIFERDDVAVVSAIALALMPQLFIWSRTQAVPDLPFMLFSIITFIFFFIFLKKSNAKTLAPFLFMLILTIYMRTEAILLVLVFLLSYLIFIMENERGIRLRTKIKRILEVANSNVLVLLELTVFFILLLPQLYYISIEAANPDFGQSFTNQKAFSFSNFMLNAPQNIQFLLGGYNQVYQYPVVFPEVITFIAILGAVLLAIDRRQAHRFTILGSLLIWFIAYMLFYDFFYAGSATFGVDSRFMLQLTPELTILAAFGLVEVAEIAAWVIRRVRKGREHMSQGIKYAILSLLVLAFVIYPFTWYIPNITLPPSSMPQQNVIYPAVSSFYADYNSVPTNCLVFTFTPDMWYEFNRSAAQIDYLTSSNANFDAFAEGYSCFVFDYGYWCDVPPYRNTTCSDVLSSYSHAALSINETNSSTVAFYRLLNYTP